MSEYHPAACPSGTPAHTPIRPATPPTPTPHPAVQAHASTAAQRLRGGVREREEELERDEVEREEVEREREEPEEEEERLLLRPRTGRRTGDRPPCALK